MTKAKKKSRLDSLENILIEGEEVLWQGKPHASLVEYLSEKPLKLNKSEKLESVLLLPCMILGSATGIALLILVSNLMDTIVSSVNGIVIILGFLVTVIVLGLGMLLFTSLYLALALFIIRLFQNLIAGTIEKPFVHYAITDKRIIIVTGQRVYEFLNHVAVNGIEIEDGEHGATITWLAESYEGTPIERFLGLSEFDVTHLTEIVESRSSLVVEIEDKREGRAST